MLKKFENSSIGVFCSVEHYSIKQSYHSKILSKIKKSTNNGYRPKVQIGIKQWILRFFSKFSIVIENKLDKLHFISRPQIQKISFYG